MAAPNPLWDLIQSYMDLPTHRYPPRPADLARETGVSDQVISKWKQKPILPTAEQLTRFAKGTGIPYIDLLEAALRGKGYLPTSAAGLRLAPALSDDLLVALEADHKVRYQALSAAVTEEVAKHYRQGDTDPDIRAIFVEVQDRLGSDIEGVVAQVPPEALEHAAGGGDGDGDSAPTSDEDMTLLAARKNAERPRRGPREQQPD